jgi:predicted phage tail protein
MLTTVKLSGKLGKKFGCIHNLSLDTRSPREAILALSNTIPGFKSYLASAHKDGITFAVFRGRDGENISASKLSEPAGEVIRIAPINQGSKSGVL